MPCFLGDAVRGEGIGVGVREGLGPGDWEGAVGGGEGGGDGEGAGNRGCGLKGFGGAVGVGCDLGGNFDRGGWDDDGRIGAFGDGAFG